MPVTATVSNLLIWNRDVRELEGNQIHLHFNNHFFWFKIDIDKKPKADNGTSNKNKVKSTKKKSLYSDTIYTGRISIRIVVGGKIKPSL